MHRNLPRVDGLSGSESHKADILAIGNSVPSHHALSDDGRAKRMG